MIQHTLKMPDGLSLRLVRDSDRVFLESLHSSTRDDLRLIDGENDFIEEIIDMQLRAQTSGYGDMYPNAMHFIIENQGEKIGRVVLDFGHNEIHVIDLAFIREARCKGFGTKTLKSVQMVAGKVMAPVSLSVYCGNPQAKLLYLSLGFRVEGTHFPFERMVWYPSAQG